MPVLKQSASRSDPVSASSRYSGSRVPKLKKIRGTENSVADSKMASWDWSIGETISVSLKANLPDSSEIFVGSTIRTAMGLFRRTAWEMVSSRRVVLIVIEKSSGGDDIGEGLPIGGLKNGGGMAIVK